LTRRLNYAINTMTAVTHIAYSSLPIWIIQAVQLLNAIACSIQSFKCKMPQRKLGIKLFILSNNHVKMSYRMPWIETDNIFWSKYFMNKYFMFNVCCVYCWLFPVVLTVIVGHFGMVPKTVTVSDCMPHLF